jgi:Na+/proline symporter
MASIIISIIVYFVAAYFIKRYMDDADIPKGMVRSAFIFTLALAISYGVAVLVEKVA